MEWWQSLLLVIGLVLLFMASKYPIAFVFLSVNLGMFFVFLKGFSGLKMYVLSLLDSLNLFSMVAVPMFMLMGDVLFRSGMAMRSINAMEKLLKKMPGRLSVLSSIAGIIFAATSGSVMANTAMLGSLLGDEMRKKGYHKDMIFGPIMSAGTLAMLIPPSAQAVLYASIAEISVGQVLIGGVIPGVILGLGFMGYIIIRCKLNPSLAPMYDVEATPLKEKLRSFVFDILPLGILIFAVIGTIILGIATPLEAAALGALGAFLLCFYNRTFSWKLLKDSAISTFKMTGMVFAIVAGATGFGQMLSFMGAVSNISTFATSLDVHPIVIVIVTQIVIIIGGAFIDSVPLMMMTIPIFFPIITKLGFDPIWFAVLNMVNLSMANVTPPFGMVLFVMKGVAPKGTTMGEVYRSIVPYLIVDVLVMALMIIFPPMVTWLPSLMY